MITENDNQKNMYNIFFLKKKKCEVLYKQNYKGVSEMVRKIRIREYVQNRIVLLYEGQNVIMSDFY